MSINDGQLWQHFHSHYSLFEVSSKGVRLVVLNLTVLDRSGAQELIELDGVNGSCTLFILSGLWADPVVDIIAHSAACLLSLESQWTHFVPASLAHIQRAKSINATVCFNEQTSSCGVQNHNDSWATFSDLQTEVRSSHPHKSFHKTSLGLVPAPFSVHRENKVVILL